MSDSNDPLPTVAPGTVAAFREDGAAVLRGPFVGWIEPLRAGVARNMAEPSPDVRIYESAGGGRFFGDYCNWQRIPEFADFIRHSPAAAIARQLMGSRSVRLFHEHVLVKEPGADVPTPWHQDQPYYCVDGEQSCSLWIPLDPVDRATSPEFVAGSHRWGRFFRPERFNKTPLNEDDGLEPVPDIDGHRGDYRILGWALEPGDAIAFSYRTVHGAPANRRQDRARRAFSLRVVGEDATFARRPGVTSPPFREVRLAHGAPLDGPEFPLLIGG
jgi:ectoine hydroxylase-related dioxygenase (phytanoyl-CoA dioxygenase family)